MASKYEINYTDFVTKLFPWLLRNADFYTSKDGDLVYGDSLNQEVDIILQSGKGNYYQYPRIGLNLQSKINASTNKSELKRQIVQALKEDNVIVDSVDVITVDDIKRLNITDTNLINAIKQDKLIISVKARR